MTYDRVIEEHATQARGVIVVIDSVNVSKEVHDVASVVYDVISSNTLHQLPILVLCNKQVRCYDVLTYLTISYIFIRSIIMDLKFSYLCILD